MSHQPLDAEEKTKDGRVHPHSPAGSTLRWEFVIEDGSSATRRRPLNGHEVIVGRSSDAHLSIASDGLSRRHARFARDGEQWTVEDLDSRNGVYLNGVKVHSATLRNGDVVQLANVIMVLREIRE